MKEGYIKVQLDYAPTTNGKKFAEWCAKYGFVPLGSGRRAWCGSLSTYLRDAAGVAFNDGELFLFWDEDVVTDMAAQKPLASTGTATPPIIDHRTDMEL